MGLLAKLPTKFGEERDCYVALICFPVLTKHSQSLALFRGFLSKDAFDAHSENVWEREIPFDYTTDENPGPQAYAALQAYDFASAERVEYAELSERLEALSQEAAEIEAHLGDLRAELDAFDGPTMAEDGEVIHQNKEAELRTGIATDEDRTAKITEEIEAGEARLSQLLETILPADELRAQLAAAQQV